MSSTVQITGKIGSIYPNAYKKEPTYDLSTEFEARLQKEKPIITLKVDGTCGAVIRVGPESYVLARRQDIKVGSPNHELSMSGGKVIILGSTKAFVSEIKRGGGKNPRECPIYFFNLDPDDKPKAEGPHVIGFTPVQHSFGEDKNIISAIDGTNGSDTFDLWTTSKILNETDSKIQMLVEKIKVADLLGDADLMTVEILGSKVSKRYGYKDDRHLIMAHGSVTYPDDKIPNYKNHLELQKWFQADQLNPWANVEGLVFYFSDGTKYKVHRGHVGIEESWQSKSESGIEFIFDSK